ncbi:MAG: type IV pilus modification protein PilV [Gammaproteobacteria bacterium]|jgi:type IV pilus assembly protein PilV
MKSVTANTASTAADIKRQHGLTMIEVLVTLIILSVGLLGLAGLQGVAKRSSHQAYQRTLATQLVDGIIERIRANPTAAANYHTGTSSPLGGATRGESAPSPDCSSSTCTAAQMASYELWSWEQAIDGATITEDIGGVSTKEGGLIVPAGCIVFAADAGKTNTGKLSVILSWRGLSEITDAAESGVACGSGAADARRRQTVVNTYIIDETE